jgi:hypothetical protein
MDGCRGQSKKILGGTDFLWKDFFSDVSVITRLYRTHHALFGTTIPRITPAGGDRRTRVPGAAGGGNNWLRTSLQ